MPTVTDEDLLELVDRFDIAIEDTTTTDRLREALREKLGKPFIEDVSEDFLSRFQTGVMLRYESLPAVGVHYELYHRAPTRAHPGGLYEGTFRDIMTGRFVSYSDVEGLLGEL